MKLGVRYVAPGVKPFLVDFVEMASFRESPFVNLGEILVSRFVLNAMLPENPPDVVLFLARQRVFLAVKAVIMRLSVMCEQRFLDAGGLLMWQLVEQVFHAPCYTGFHAFAVESACGSVFREVRRVDNGEVRFACRTVCSRYMPQAM